MFSSRLATCCLLLLLLAFTGGCSYNGFKLHYKPNDVDAADISPCPSEPMVSSIQTHPDERLFLEMWSRGYSFLGESAFWSTMDVHEKDAVEQAKAVGACIVLVYSKHAGTVTNLMPVFNYTPPASYQTETTGRIGNTRYAGNTTITQQGPGTTNTSYIPIQQDKREYIVTYWHKVKPSVLGVMVQQLPDEVRKQLKRNTGVIVSSVMEGSPAFLANIVPGDILVKIADYDILTTDDFRKAKLPLKEKQSYTVVVLRDGQEITKELTKL